jgi:hypothetical protein
MSEEAAPAPTAVKQKNWTLAVPPTRDHAHGRRDRLPARRRGCLLLDSGQAKPNSEGLFTDRERLLPRQRRVTRPFPGRVARGRAPLAWMSVGVVLEGDADPGAHVVAVRVEERGIAAEVEDLAGELGDEAVGAPAA